MNNQEKGFTMSLYFVYKPNTQLLHTVICNEKDSNRNIRFCV
jgi:hypothetical protein